MKLFGAYYFTIKAEYKILKFYFSCINMCRYSFFIVIIAYFTVVESACPLPYKFYLDCSNTSTLSNAVQTCNRYGMTLLNLTNSSSTVTDIIDLNQTLISANCAGYFWFSSGNVTGYVANSASLGTILAGLLAGTLNLVIGVVASLVNCLIIFCSATTTPAPITQAAIVCTRPIQQQVIQKCQLVSPRTDMKIFQFTSQPMYGGILDSFVSQSRTACSGQCSENTQCIGISYINNICNLYM
jgi:hypothetical protein